ncbi:MAG: hypothetical protein EBZ58_10825 [Bacteroidetes bacterium]|nr:hypothetical protein [Bacteroidota bacterium]
MLEKLTLKIIRSFGVKYFQDENTKKSYLPYYTYKDGKTPLPSGWARLKDENGDFYIKYNRIPNAIEESSFGM